MELILVRHGQSEGNLVYGDYPDPPLTALGKLQAESVGCAVAALVPDIVAASPLERSLHTAQPAARKLGKRVEVWKLGSEIRTYGETYIGPAVAALRAVFPEFDFGDDLEPEGWHYIPDRDMAEAQQRAARFIATLREKYDGKKVAFFGHGTLNQLLLHSLLGLGHPAHDRISFHQHNGCINRFLLNNDKVTVCSVDDVSHLLQDGIAYN